MTVFNNTIADPKMTVTILEKALRHAVLDRGRIPGLGPERRAEGASDGGILQPEELHPGHEYPPRGERDAPCGRPGIAGKEPCHHRRLGGLSRWRSGPLPCNEGSRPPFITTFRAKGILPEENPWLVSVLGTVGSPEARVLAQEADPLICLGVGFSKQTNVPLDRPMVQLDIDPVKLGKNPASVSLWGNCHSVLPRFLEMVAQREDPEVLPRIAALKEKIRERIDAEADPRAVPVRPPYIMKVLSETIPEDAIISIDVGENGWWFGRNFRMKRQRFVMSGYLATMGFSLPGAIAAKLAHPEKTVFCITGDGGFAMAMAELVTAVKYHLPMVVVVLNNRESA